MQSFAFWYEKREKNSTEDVIAKLNFNLWANCGWENDTTYFDIGFLIKEIKKVKKVFIFVPFKVEQENLEDLGCKLKENLPSAIFNENLAAKTQKEKLIPIENEANPKESFSVYVLNPATDIKRNEGFDDATVGNGTVLSISLVDENAKKGFFDDIDEKNVYFRFRIKKDNFKEIVSEFELKPKGIQSYLSTTYMIDFRFFNKRTLSADLLQKIGLYETFSIESVHFLLMTRTSVNNLSLMDCLPRKLEKEVWDDYIGAENSSNDLIAYHYKKSFKKKDGEEVGYKDDSVDFFIKYAVEKSVFWKYLGITIAIGALGSVLANILWALFTAKCKN